MKKVIRISTYVIFSLGFGILGYISFNNGDVESNKTKPEDVNKVSLHASWGEEEGSVEELVSETDLIVMGTLGEELETIEPRENIVYTKYDFKINETIKGETSNCPRRCQ